MANQIKRGIVVEGRGAQVRVQFADDDVISGWLDVVQSSTSGTKVFRRPEPGSLVVCGMDKNWESGVVLGATFSEDNPAPRNSAETTFIQFPDSSTLEVAGGSFTLNLASGLIFTLQGTTCTITGDVKIIGDTKITGKLTVDGDTDLAATKINGVGQVGS